MNYNKVKTLYFNFRELPKYSGYIHIFPQEIFINNIAFLTSITEKAGLQARYLHQGMTSSDVLDTSFNIQLVQSGKILINDIDNLEFTFLHENSWHESWPISLITSKKIPTLIKIEFSKQNKNYSWIIDPNIIYAIQN